MLLRGLTKGFAEPYAATTVAALPKASSQIYPGTSPFWGACEHQDNAQSDQGHKQGPTNEEANDED